MDIAQFKQRLAHMLRAKIPLIHVVTTEEARALKTIEQIACDQEMIKTKRTVDYMDLAVKLEGEPNSKGFYMNIFSKEKFDYPFVLIVYDMHVYFNENNVDYELVRALKGAYDKMKLSEVPVNIIFLSATAKFPPELEKDIATIDFPLPGTEEIGQLLDTMIKANEQGAGIKIALEAGDRERLVQAALGLTINETESAYALAMVKDGQLCKDDVEIVLEEKRQIIRRSGLLEYIGGGIRMDEVGGLDNLKRWLTKRNDSWSEEAAQYGVSAPKGILLTGVPGCGKSLIAKAVSTSWQLPLLRLDVGKLFGMWIGTSESNIRNAIRIAEAVAPCVLWIDEIEKGFSGVGSTGDSGTASRVFGTFLTWMQEKTKMVFVIATANDISRLPPEMMRKGRFDEIFFVDLPNAEEREQIIGKHLHKRLKRSVDSTIVRALAAETDGFSGAELEQFIVSGLFEAFSERRPVEQDDMMTAIRATVPLSVTQAEKIGELRQWAAVRAIPASVPPQSAAKTDGPRSQVTVVD